MSQAAAPPRSAGRPLLARAAIVLALTLVLAFSARVQVPFWPVPMTLQTLAVLGIAGFAGPQIAGAAMLGYLAEGAAGLPVEFRRDGTRFDECMKKLPEFAAGLQRAGVDRLTARPSSGRLPFRSWMPKHGRLAQWESATLTL